MRDVLVDAGFGQGDGPIRHGGFRLNPPWIGRSISSSAYTHQPRRPLTRHQLADPARGAHADFDSVGLQVAVCLASSGQSGRIRQGMNT
jgi:hypothetical protein